MSATAYLIVLSIASSGSSTVNNAYPMPSMDECYKAVQSSKVAVATGGDAESSVALFCTPDLSKFWNLNGGKWYPVEIEE